MQVDMDDGEWFIFWVGVLLVLLIAIGVPCCTAYNMVHDAQTAGSFQAEASTQRSP